MSPRKKPPFDNPQLAGPQRLQRVMAAAGIGSRRECEAIIEEGRVEVDGQVVTQLGVKVDSAKQEIYVDAQPIQIERLQYFMLNKPPGIVSTSSDPSGRVRVIDLIQTESRVYNVGRLDQSSEGLILVTNDGDLANRLTHPRYGIEKKYHVQVAGAPTPAQLRSLEEGVYMAEGKAKATSAKFLRRIKQSSWIEIVLAEGRNREIRRMLAGIDHKVRTLKRVSIGPLKLGDLPVGAHRRLTDRELKSLKQAAEGRAKKKSAKKKPPKKKSDQKKSDQKTDDRKKASAAAKSDSGRKSTSRHQRADEKPSRKKPNRKLAAKKKSTSRSGKPGSNETKSNQESRRGAGRNKPKRSAAKRTTKGKKKKR